MLLFVLSLVLLFTKLHYKTVFDHTLNSFQEFSWLTEKIKYTAMCNDNR